MSQKYTIIFVIAGEDVPVEVNPNEPLHVAVTKALKESSNTSRPRDDWEARNADGSLLGSDAKISALGLAAGARVMLSPKVGGGG
jgi:uncharacterized protein DUF2604